MQASAFGLGFTEMLILLFGGHFLGLVPGERDPELIKSPPAAAYFYQEWTDLGPTEPGTPGVAGLLADPEIQTFLTTLAEAVNGSDANGQGSFSELEAAIRAELTTLLKFTAVHAGCLYVSGGTAGDHPAPILPLEGALVLSLGDDADEFLASLNRLLKHLPGYEPSNNPQDHSIPIATIPAKLHRVGDTVIVAVGVQTLPRLLARRDQKHAEMIGQDQFAAAWKTADAKKVGRFAWINVAALREELPVKFGVSGAIAQMVVKALGLGEVDSILTVSRDDGPDALIETRINVGERQAGVLRLLGGRGLTQADFAGVPADADFVAAISLNLDRVQQTAREIIQSSAPDALAGYDEFQRQLEQELQLQAADLTAAFGDSVIAYDAPSTGGLGLTGLVVAVPVNDQKRAAMVVERLRQLIVESIQPSDDDGQTTLAQSQFQGETIHYLNASGHSVRYQSAPPWSPAFCLTKSDLLIGLTPQAIKGHLRFAASNESRFAAESLIPADGDLIVAVMVDTPRIAQTVWPLLPYLLKADFAESQANGVPLKLGDFPSSRAVLPYLQRGSLTVVRGREDIVIRQRNTLPIALATSLLPRMIPAGDEYFHEDVMPLEGRNEAPHGAPAVDLGGAVGADDTGGVVQAKAEAPAAETQRELTAVERAALKALPALIKGMLPDRVEQFVPDVVIQQISNEMTPERIEERRLDRERRKAERAAKRAARKARVD